jgi:DNA processing protein
MAQRVQIRALVPDLKFADDVLFELLTVSLLEPGCNTRTARAAKDLLAQDDLRYLADRVASAVWLDSVECASRLMRGRAEATRALAAAREPAATVITILDERYPEVLKEIADPPVVLWVCGRPESLASVCVGVVGSRDATPASLALALKLGRELSEAGVTVVSGLARGVDGAAHAGALEGVTPTIAVLGSGLSVIYPKRHEPLAQRIQERGAIISELPPWFPPYRRHFPLRNRIISGMSEGVVVIEAGEDSGSLITADAAGEQNRDVMAVPGPPLSGRHRGSNALIKDGARLVETVDDILEEIGWHSMPKKVQNAGNRLQLNYLEETMAVGESYSVDFLATRTGRIVTDLLPDLAELELSGRITRLTGGHFMRLPERG